MTPGPASRPGPAGGRRRHEAAAGGALLLVAHGRAASAAAAPDGGGGSRSGSDGSSVLGPSLVPLSRKLQDGHSLPRATRTKKKKHRPQRRETTETTSRGDDSDATREKTGVSLRARMLQWVARRLRAPRTAPPHEQLPPSTHSSADDASPQRNLRLVTLAELCSSAYLVEHSTYNHHSLATSYSARSWSSRNSHRHDAA